MKWIKRILLSLVVFVAVAYVGVCVWLRANETRLIFGRRLPVVTPSSSLALNQQRVEFADGAGTKFIAWIIPSLLQDHSDIWLIHFHGSGANISSDSAGYDDFRAMGFNIIAPEYPGYGDAPGEPSEAAVESAAKAAYDYLRTKKNVPPKNIVIFGGSLGSAVAIDLASRVQAAALIEHAGFTSMVDMGNKQYPFLPIALLARNKFESDKKIAQVKMPILIIHGREDEVIPYSQGERLYQLAPEPKRFMEVRGPHGPAQARAAQNPNFLNEIVTFLNTQAGFHVRAPMPSIAPVVQTTLNASGVEVALTQYHALRRENPVRYNFREVELNDLGYYFLARNEFDKAIAVFQLNAEQFPQSFNVFDSLGDAFAAAGKNAEAIQSYEKSLALFPDQANYSRGKLEQLQRKAGSS